jgi:probable rRNA maturation factor
MKYIIETDKLSISYNIRKAPKIDGVFLHKIKNSVLGNKYELNIYFVGPKKIRSVNKKFRKKDYVTDILSFPFLEDDFGEIYICLDKVKQKSKLFDTNFENYLNYLFIHGMIHLKGLDHGDEMDKLEKKYTKKLNIFYPY